MRLFDSNVKTCRKKNVKMLDNFTTELWGDIITFIKGREKKIVHV